jgi:hypothetical protein
MDRLYEVAVVTLSAVSVVVAEGTPLDHHINRTTPGAPAVYAVDLHDASPPNEVAFVDAAGREVSRVAVGAHLVE